LKKNTRRYAKRQLTWFRADDRIEWIDANRDPSEVVKDIAERIRDTEEQ
ncbi:MAG: tRNA (adenosine(37)-N6)-dimethylallyltransferase MiaA, partial [Candidatus Omnitrophica bacterium]|nr:tRNA (adenosine(37)-N6)-dimethylallyltransferase MiaA [Candidatus Omnitrophota bacterium]